jgi:heavy metal sensor kinase
MFNSIRVRLTLWYLLAFGALLAGFSAYVYSALSQDLNRQFDVSLLRTARSMANYFAEFVERKNVTAGARETVLELQLERLGTAIFREDELLAASGPDTEAAVASTKILAASRTASGATQKPVFATDSRSGKRLVAVTAPLDGVNYEVVVLEPLAELRGQLARMGRIIFVGLPAALILAVGGGFLLARKSLQPVVTISEQAARISARNLDERLHIANPKDELGKLAGVINSLLSRLETSFRIMREFMADASHELRTPLAIIHGESEVSLSRDGTTCDYRGSLAVIHKQSNRMARIVSDMLALARADAGKQQLIVEELYLNDLVEECCRAAQALAVPKGVQLTYESSEDVSFRGNEELLKRMAVNLLDNAIHYTPSGGRVSVKLASEPARVRLIVVDTGIGIPPECVERVFDRFYRVDGSRTRADGGSGLGLSIVKLAAESHKGSVDLISQVGQGSTFTVSLPLDPAA